MPLHATATSLLPMLARSSQPFDDSAYIFETKWDGVRAIAAVEERGVRVWGMPFKSLGWLH
jgi:ATP-dependent DNA ligase